MLATSHSIFSIESPPAAIAPTSEPMLVPTIASYSMPSVRSALSTPMCAMPRMPPPPGLSPGRRAVRRRPNLAPDHVGLTGRIAKAARHLAACAGAAHITLAPDLEVAARRARGNAAHGAAALRHRGALPLLGLLPQ